LCESKGRGLRGGETRPGGCTRIKLLLHVLLLARKFLAKHEITVVPPTALLSRFGPFRLFLVPGVENHSEMLLISDENRFRRKFTMEPMQKAFQNWKKHWKQCTGSRGGGVTWKETSLMKL
jgi:hypothetical protein